MLFAVGTKVQFRYTGEKGVITALLGEDMLKVKLLSDPDLEIPAFEEDLIRDEGTAPVAGAKFVAIPNSKQPASTPARRVVKCPYMILKPKGVQLAFEPMPGRDGTVTRYKAWMVNETNYEFILEFDLYTGTKDIIVLDDKLPASSALELGDMLYDDLNDQPEVWAALSRITTAGPDQPIEKTIKIRPKQFFNNLHTAAVLSVQTYQFLLFDRFEPVAQKKEAPAHDLKAYTKQALGTRRSTRKDGNAAAYKSHDVAEFAQFVPEIDLHADTLLRGHANIDKKEILRLQMAHFHGFLDKAVRLGVPRVFIIHGLGEGKLRESISKALRAHPHVTKFKNEYHHKYGYGATEVIFE